MESKQIHSDSASDSSSPFPISSLNAAYESVSKVTYGGTVSLLLVVAGVSFGAAYVLPSSRGVILSIGATALFGAILLAAITPERFVTVTLTQSLQGVAAGNTSSLVEALELDAPPRYVPTESGIRLFIPSLNEMETPTPGNLDETIIGDDSVTGLLLEPTGAGILEEFERDGGKLPDDHHQAVDLLVSVAVDQLHLADSVTVDSIDDDHVTLRVVGSIFDDEEDVDHPVQSFFAVALATVLEATVRSLKTETEDRDTILMTLRWENDQ